MWVDEEVVELTDLFCHEHCREPDDSIIDGSDTDSALLDRSIGEFECVGVGEQVRAIAFVRERRTSEDVAECWHVCHHCESQTQIACRQIFRHAAV